MASNGGSTMIVINGTCQERDVEDLGNNEPRSKECPESRKASILLSVLSALTDSSPNEHQNRVSPI